MSLTWPGTPQPTPRQRDVQAAHRHGFWSGFRRGYLIGGVTSLPFWVAFLIWWYLT